MCCNRWSGTMLGHTMKVFLQYGKIKAAVEVMNKIHVSKNRLSSFVPYDILDLMVDSCIQTDNTSTALVNLTAWFDLTSCEWIPCYWLIQMVVEYADDVGFSECSSMAEKIGSKMQLDDQQRNQLQNIIGRGVTKPKTTKSMASTKSTKPEKSNRPRSSWITSVYSVNHEEW